MKFSAALSLAVAPLAIAKAVHNVYPRKRHDHGSDSGSIVEASSGGDSVVAIDGSSSDEVIIIWVNPGNNAATTTVTQTVTQTAAAGSSVAAAATHSVTVGGDAGLVYTPSSITANVGDMVVFTFQSENHTVTQSGFTTPCEKLSGGTDSGFQPNPSNSVNPPPQMAMQVMVSTPLWFYCRQTGHCGKGMVFSINPTATKTQAIFQQQAIAQNGTASSGSSSSSSAAVVASSVAASSVAASSSAAAVSTGTGQVSGGACVCAVTCATGSFPVAAVQGLNAFGGYAGSLPASMMETS